MNRAEFKARLRFWFWGHCLEVAEAIRDGATRWADVCRPKVRAACLDELNARHPLPAREYRNH